ncbi:50S ribosomal protein L33 [Terrilactibacillus sp. BCM23-1]|uniref:Large ribosomal subunit protein bL33 n=1 Tax=Terrilactibacillus tamarindi TaxID=2599694 RepID=A0A6N8CRI6_9BACI|nr:50S ribosomal protein L33 [Terrilactibacillus tamarindi]MTT32784.1 50S ribosomal protein L33 [Terrilactibacillus tamarindi]
MRKKVSLECSVCHQRNYTTAKNTKTNPERIEVNKFCKTCNRHTLHRETK